MDKKNKNKNIPSDIFLTTKFCFKCKMCALEFAVYTYSPEKWDGYQPYCPECGYKSKERHLPLAIHRSTKSLPEIIYHKGIM